MRSGIQLFFGTQEEQHALKHASNNSALTSSLAILDNTSLNQLEPQPHLVLGQD